MLSGSKLSHYVSITYALLTVTYAASTILQIILIYTHLSNHHHADMTKYGVQHSMNTITERQIKKRDSDRQ